MNGKQYIGTNAETFQSYDVVGPITGIALIVDDESEYRAGDENGYVLEVPCSYGTQQMANELYAKAKGKVYKGYEATKAALSPSAELGDGVTVNGLYSILAYRSVNFGGAHRATISAPGENVINHEYPFKGTNTSKIQRQNKRNMAATRSMIEKTASEIRQRVEEVASGAQEDLEAFTEAVNKSLDELQDQIDGVIQNWFYSYLPTTANEPASLWTTDAEKIKHLGDVFYIVDNEEDGGRAFRWAQVSGQYKWVEITDEATLKALAAAAKAQDTADNKRRVFTTKPYPPYDVGDLWVQGSGGDILRCAKAKESGSYAEGDFVKASKYTDDSYAEQKYSEIDQKIDSIKLTVANGKTESTFTLKIGEAKLSSGTIKMTGLVTFENLSTSGQTTIDGGNIITGTITADKLSVTDLSALKATIGGFSIGSSAIYNGMASLSATTNGVYLGTSGIALGGGKFKVTSAGALTATNATITGTINATSGTFQSVTISGSTFSGSLNNASGTFGGSLNYASGYFGGNLYGAGGSYNGSINSSGTFSGSLSSASGSYNGSIYSSGTFSGSLSRASGTFTGTNSGKLTGTASSATLSSCTNTGYLVGSSSSHFVYLTEMASLQSSATTYLGAGGTATITASSGSCSAGGAWTFLSSMTVKGSKHRAIDTKNYGTRCLSAYETPDATFADFGTGILDEFGVCHIYIDPIFEETVQPNSIPTVFLTKYGEGDIWVELLSHDEIIIKGTPNLSFSWETRYQQGNLGTGRLNEIHLVDTDYSEKDDVDYVSTFIAEDEHTRVNYAEEAYDYLVDFQSNSIDYADEAYEYYINFERSLVQ